MLELRIWDDVFLEYLRAHAMDCFLCEFSKTALMQRIGISQNEISLKFFANTQNMNELFHVQFLKWDLIKVEYRSSLEEVHWFFKRGKV